MLFHEMIKTNEVKIQHYLIRQYNITNFYKQLFFQYWAKQIKATET